LIHFYKSENVGVISVAGVVGVLCLGE